MFFELVKKNGKKNRKENSLLFISMIVSIVAFYIILSLENQDVVRFLKSMESDAVTRLFQLIPILYGISLFFLFFLVYFAGKYQLERRSHELGMYLVLGMQRKKLFFMLFAEEMYNSVISLAVGVPVAVFLSEIVSLITAKIVGLGIIGHQLSFSFKAIVGTIVGYFVIRFLALFILSGIVVKKEIYQLLSESQEKKRKKHNKYLTAVQLFLGILILLSAYGTAIMGFAWQSLVLMSVVVVMGILGTFLLFHGLGIMFEMILKRSKNRNGLKIFTFRQLQESVFLRSNSLAVCSLLVLMALCCFGYGLSVSFSMGSGTGKSHVIDYTFQGEEKQIREELQKQQIENYMEELFAVKVGCLYTFDGEHSFSAKALVRETEKQKDSKAKEYLLNQLSYFTMPYLISESGYNKILQRAGKEPIELAKNQVVLYRDSEFLNDGTKELLDKILQNNLYVEMDGKEYQLLEEIYTNDIVTDRFITISCGLIVTDEVFECLVQDGSTTYWNGVLKEEFVKEHGLMQAIMQVNNLLQNTSVEYESYLQNMGRQLFYMIAGSYTTIYLAVIFFLIANTVIGVQFFNGTAESSKKISHTGLSWKLL